MGQNVATLASLSGYRWDTKGVSPDTISDKLCSQPGDYVLEETHIRRIIFSLHQVSSLK
jgi:hypothetical protein